MNDNKDLKDKEAHNHDHECCGGNSCGGDCECDGDEECGGGCCDDKHCGSDHKPENDGICDDACFCGTDNDAIADIDHDSYEAKYLRALADYHNLLKRTVQEKQEFFQYATTNFLQDMLPIYDNLKLSVSNLSEDDAKSPWVEGVKHVIKQFKESLVALGVAEINTVGEKFDHNTMEALEGSGEMVKKEVKAGYTLNGKVIVPAKVIVE
ncbi:MAG: nucleotide exchange factor GrpE [Candidatus Falkowbacteria bacterium]